MTPPAKKSIAKKRRSRAAATGSPAAAGSQRRARGGGAPSGPRGWWRAVVERRLLERLGWWLAIATLLLPPFVMLAGIRDPFRLPKSLLAELLVPLSLVFLAFGLRRIDRVDGRRILSLPAVRALGPLWVVALISGLASAHSEHSLEAMWSLSIGVAAVIAWSVALPRKRRALDLMLIPGVALAVIAVLQHHEIFRPFELARATGRIQMSSLAGNVADLGAYLVLPLLIAQAGAMRALAAGRKPLFAGTILVALLLLYALLLGQTLSALAAAFAASALFWLLRAPRRWRVLLVVGTLAVGVVGLLLVEPVRKRVANKVREVRAGRLNDVLTGRLDGWRTGVDMLARNPLLGVGPGAYRAEFAPTKLAMIEEGETFWWGHTDGSLFINAHNEPIELAAELGGLGLLALGWCVVVVLGELRRRPLSPVDAPGGAPGGAGTGGAGAAGSKTAVGRSSKGKSTLGKSALGKSLAKSRARDRLAAGALVAAADRRALEWSGLVALAVLSMTYFPLRTALVAYPYLLLLSWVLEPSRGLDAIGETEGSAAAGSAAGSPTGREEVAA